MLVPGGRLCNYGARWLRPDKQVVCRSEAIGLTGLINGSESKKGIKSSRHHTL